jgi:hypothetical protein
MHSRVAKFLELDSWVKHDAKCFVMLHCSSAIRDTEWEGAKPLQALEYYRALLRLPDHALDLGISPAALKTIQETLEELIYFFQLYKTASPEEMIQQIQARCSAKGVCYLPSGFSGEKVGHFAVLKITPLADGCFACSMLDQGAGMKFHRLISINGDKLKRDYQSREYAIDFAKPSGKEFLEKIMTIATDRKIYELPLIDKQKPIVDYSEDDLYGALECYGKKLPANPITESKGVTPLRAGACTVTNTKCVERDVLATQHGTDLKTIKRVHFVIKQSSLIEAYKSYLRGTCELKHLEWALREYYVRIGKRYPETLSDADLQASIEIGEIIYQRLTEDKRKMIQEKSTAKPLPPLQGEWKKARRQVLAIATESKSISIVNSVQKEELKAEPKLDTNGCTAHTVVAYLNQAVQYFAIPSGKLGLMELRKFMHSLAAPTGNKEDAYWDSVSEEDAKIIIEKLSLLIQYPVTLNCKTYRFEMALIAYDIAAQLAPRIPELKLENKYVPTLDDIYSSESFYVDAIGYHTIHKIVHNFIKRGIEKEPILGNAVDIDPTNVTKNYVMKILLTADKKTEAMNRLKQELGNPREELSDEQLFQALIEDSVGEGGRARKFYSKDFLGTTFCHLMAIAGTAHARGDLTSSYVKGCYLYNRRGIKGNLFDKSKFHHEFWVSQKEYHKFSDVYAYFPKTILAQNNGRLHADFAENTIYHPLDHLNYLRANKPDLMAFGPYQINASGTFSEARDIRSPTSNLIENMLTEKQDELDEELRSIECAPSLRAQNALEWAQAHVDDLVYQSVRARIFNLLFGYNQLDNALATTPHDMVLLITHFLQVGFEFYHHLNATFFWLCDIQAHLKHYVEVSAQLYHFDPQATEWPDVRRLLIEKSVNANDVNIKKELAQRIIVTYKNAQVLSIEDALRLLICHIIIHTQFTEEDWRENYKNEISATMTEEVWLQHRDQIFSLLSMADNEKLDAYANVIIADGINLPCAYHWYREGNYLKSIETAYEIDLIKGEIKRGGQCAYDWTKELRSHFVINRLGLNNDQLSLVEDGSNIQAEFLDNKKYRKITTANGEFEFYTSFGQPIAVYRHIQIEGKRQRFKWQFKIEGANNVEQYKDLQIYLADKDIKNPFDLEHYHYWVCMEDEGSLFVDQISDKSIGHLKIPGYDWVQLENQGMNWRYSGAVVLNLAQPTTEIEAQWKARLESSVGVAGVKIQGKVTNTYCEIVGIEFSNLRLSFTARHGQLESNDFPKFVLSTQTSIEALNGFQMMLVLENVEDPRIKKYIVPAYTFNITSDSAALSDRSFIDTTSLLTKNFYIYEQRRDGSLRGNNLNADLYLATLYRCQGDYRRAMQCLLHTMHHTNNTADLEKIINQLGRYKDLSPLGAAFDCKVACRMYKHVQKWSKAPNTWLKGGDLSEFVKNIEKQYEYYKSTTSTYKHGINIVPEYLRLNADERAILEHIQQQISRKDRANPLGPDEKPIIVFYASFNTKRLDELKKCAWPSFFHKTVTFSATDALQAGNRPTFVRVYQDPTRTPALTYLKRYYVNLFREALSADPEIVRRLKADLFYLLNNDKDITHAHYALIASLITVMNKPSDYADLNNLTQSAACLASVEARYRSKTQAKAPFQFLDTLADIAKIEREKSLANPLPEPEKVEYAMASIELADAAKHPLQLILSAYFLKTNESIASRPFPLDKAALVDALPLAQSILKCYRKGHRENQKNKKPIYNFRVEENLVGLRAALSAQKSTDKIDLDKREIALLALANHLPENEQHNALLRAARRSEQLPDLNLNDLVQALLTQNVHMLTQRNPFLTQADIAQLMSQFCDYAIVQSRIDQADEALQLIGNKKEVTSLDRYQKQLLGTILDKERHPEFSHYPEFLVYEYLTKRMLRMDQADALIKLIKLIESGDLSGKEWRHGLLQFAAGGGKTAVLIPLLAHRFARRGLLPCIMNTSELYSIGVQDIPESLRASLQQNMEVIECELEHPWTKAELDRLYCDLEMWRLQGKCLLLKAITWHSLNIAERMARAEGNEEVAKSAEKVLDFFANKTVKLEDESQLISNPLQESIKTYGPRQTIDLSHQRLFMRFYDCLFGRVENCKHIVNLAGLAEEGKKQVSLEKLAIIQEALTAQIIQESCFAMLSKQDLSAYLTQSSRERPRWWRELHQTNPALADLVVLARAFIQTHLPHILSLQYGKNYGISIHAGDLTAAPKHDGMDTTAHYGDQMLVMALTIQLYEIKGVPANYVRMIIEKLCSDHIQERRWNKGTTEAERILNQLLPDDWAYVPIDTLSNPMINELSQQAVICKHPPMVKEFLYQYAFPQIATPKYRVVSTPADLQAGFKRSIMFSATPGLRETYPVFLKAQNCFYESAFEAQVIDKLLQPQNSAACLIEMADSAKNFFTEIKEKQPELFMQLTGLIDRGALLSNTNAEAVMTAFLDSVSADDLRQVAAGFDTQGMVLQSRHPRVKSVRIDGANLNEALARQGLKMSDLLVFLFLDLSKTTGTDVKRPYKDRAGLTVGKEQTVTEIIQAAMRERQLLCDDAQSVIWIMFKSLYEEIHPEAKQVDLRHIFYWMIKNEAEQTASKVIMRAYQGIAQQIEAIIRDKIRRGEAPYGLYHERLQKSVTLLPSEAYEIESQMDAAATVCKDYAISLCNYFGLDYVALPADTAKNIAEIIQETKDLIKEMRKPHGAELNATVCQEQQALMENKQEMKEEQKVQTLYNSQTNIKYNLEEYGEKDRLDHIFKPNNLYQPLTFERCSDLRMPKLLLCKQHFSPIESAENERSPYIDWLKPVRHLVVKINPDHSYQFIACTRAGAEFFRNEIQRLDEAGNTDYYAILGEDGHILASSKALALEQKQMLMQSEHLLEMVNFAAFLNGRVKNPIVMSQIVRKYGWAESDYHRLAGEVARVHVSRQAVKLTNLPKFEELCGWKKPVPSKDNSHAKSKTSAQRLPLATLAGSKLHFPARVVLAPRDMEPQSVLPASLFGKQAAVRAGLSKKELRAIAENKKQQKIQELKTQTNYMVSTPSSIIGQLYSLEPPMIRFIAFPGREDCFAIYELAAKEVKALSGAYSRKIIENDKVLHVAAGGALSVHKLKDAEKADYTWDKPLADDPARYFAVIPPAVAAAAIPRRSDIFFTPASSPAPIAAPSVKGITAKQVTEIIAEYYIRKKQEGLKIPNLATETLIRKLKAANNEKDRYDLLAAYVNRTKAKGKTNKTFYRVILDQIGEAYFAAPIQAPKPKR